MKVVVIGASGTIGKAIVQELSSRHEIVAVGKSSGKYQCDIKDQKSLHDLFKNIGAFDALVSAAGSVHFGAFEEMNEELYQLGLQDKLMGQVNLVLVGREYINERGSFTLISGILASDPIRFGSSASMVNGAIDSFVKASSIEMRRSVRINAVSPSIVIESMGEYESYFRGFEPVSAARVALAYSKSVEGLQTGQIYDIH